MNHIDFSEGKRTKFKYVILVPYLDKTAIVNEYINPFGLDKNDVIAIELFKEGKRTKASVIKDYSNEIIEEVKFLEAKYLIVGDSDYYKTLSGHKKSDSYVGYVTRVDDYYVSYCPNFKQIFYNPDKVRTKIKQTMLAIRQHDRGAYKEPGTNILQSSEYLTTAKEIISFLNDAAKYNNDITLDIEAFSLKHYEAGIGTVSIGFNKTTAVTFPVDFLPAAKSIRAALKQFLLNFKHKIIYHNASFDLTVLIYQLFMDHIEDYKGLVDAILHFDGKFHCTKIIAYLATNTCAGNELGLKPLSQEYSGNYSIEDIKDITKIPLPKLLEYNAVDAISTWYVFNKYYPIMVQDQQEDLYYEYFMPFLLDIIQMQLTGMPIIPEKVQEAKKILEDDIHQSLDALKGIKEVEEFNYEMREEAYLQKQAKLKVKKITIDDIPPHEFNPNSDPQLQRFIFEKLAYPVTKYTDSKQPATGKEILKGLKANALEERHKKIFDAFIEFKDASIILSTFISAFEKAVQGPSGQYYLFGNFNLGGTLSGRLSSNNPNMQNIPSTGSKYAKLIKICFGTIGNQLFCGLDFASLEDKISALTTRDTNKLKVYMGHKVFLMTTNQKEYLVRDDDEIIFDGKTYVGEELFEDIEIQKATILYDKVPINDLNKKNKIINNETITSVEFIGLTDKYDGHCFRAYSYFKEQMPDIIGESISSINSIAKLYKSLRQESKVPTFLLTYGGTYIGIMDQVGFPKDKAIQVESKYKRLYKESVEWVNKKIQEASEVGYVTCAFGLRLRTPLLHQVIRGNRATPFEAEQEARTAGNALGQSWGLLNNRAVLAFMRKVRKHPDLRYKVKICGQIHDASYYMIPNDAESVVWVNDNLVEEAFWQDHPEIAHDIVKLGGELSIFYPNWANEMELPNFITEDKLQELTIKHLEKLKENT